MVSSRSSPPAAHSPSGARNAFGVCSLICGLVPVVMSVIVTTIKESVAGGFWLLLLVWSGAGIVAIVMGVLSIRAASRGEATNRGMGIAGLVLGVAFSGLFLVAGLDYLFGRLMLILFR